MRTIPFQMMLAIALLAVWTTESSAQADKKPEKSEPKLASPPPKVAAELLRLHNLIRAKHKKPPFKLNAKLSSAAQKFAEYMAKEKRYGHEADGRSPVKRIEAEGYEWGSWSENLAWGTPTPIGAIDSWMNSDVHRDNILGPQQEVGFGFSRGVWVAVFGTSLQALKDAKRKERLGGGE